MYQLQRGIKVNTFAQTDNEPMEKCGHHFHKRTKNQYLCNILLPVVIHLHQEHRFTRDSEKVTKLVAMMSNN